MENKIETNNYYIYVYKDPENDKIFYVGRGKDNRCNVHLRPSMLKGKSHKNNKIKKILKTGQIPKIEKIIENISFEESINKEIEIIAEIGLENLTNITPGGEGNLGNKSFLGRKHTDETKQKMSESSKGDKNSMYGNKWTRSVEGKKYFKEKMSKRKGKFTHTEETKNKISEKLKGEIKTDDFKLSVSNGMKKVWEDRKNNNIKIKRNTKGIEIIKYLSNDKTDFIIFESLKKAALDANIDQRTFKNKINMNEKINGYTYSYV